MKHIKKALKGYAEIKKQMEKAKQAAMKPAREALLLDFHEAFKKHPNIARVKWTQYTPYFNDGEACEFGVHDLDYVDKDGNEIDSWSDETEAMRFPDPTMIDDDVMLNLFGDHVEVSLERDAKDFEVDEYSHD